MVVTHRDPMNNFSEFSSNVHPVLTKVCTASECITEQKPLSHLAHIFLSDMKRLAIVSNQIL